jgi:DNA/RNA-binding domain of Phe-tRNA-synthetase-like protein
LQGRTAHGRGECMPGLVGMLEIDPELRRQCPGVRVGCVCGSARVAPSPGELLQVLNARAGELASMAVDAAGYPEIAATRQAYKTLGKEPSRYRNSAEALLRRITSGKGLYFINNLVDINNLISLESLMPVGTYDLGKITSPVSFRAGKSGESYKGIGKDLLNIADLPVFADAEGAFGSPTSDSERAMITMATVKFAMMIISFSGSSSMSAWASRAMDLLASYAGGTDLQFEIVE